jgi:hypothetical protein
MREKQINKSSSFLKFGANANLHVFNRKFNKLYFRISLPFYINEIFPNTDKQYKGNLTMNHAD